MDHIADIASFFFFSCFLWLISELIKRIYDSRPLFCYLIHYSQQPGALISFIRVQKGPFAGSGDLDQSSCEISFLTFVRASSIISSHIAFAPFFILSLCLRLQIHEYETVWLHLTCFILFGLSQSFLCAWVWMIFFLGLCASQWILFSSALFCS